MATTTSLVDLSYNSDGALTPTRDYNNASLQLDDYNGLQMTRAIPDGASALAGDYTSNDLSYNSDGASPLVRDYKSSYSLIRYLRLQRLQLTWGTQDGASAPTGDYNIASR